MRNQAEEKIKEYELSFLIEEESIIPQILDILNKKEAEIFFEGLVKNIVLAYEIKRKRQAFFGYFNFRATPEKVEQIQNDLKFIEGLLRFLIVTPPPRRREKKEETREERREERKEHIEVGVIQQTEKKVQPETLPLSNEELEKKIDEILG